MLVDKHHYPKRARVQYRWDGEDNDYIVLINPTSGASSILNPVSARVFSLCDGDHSVEEIVQQVLQEFDAPGYTQVYNDVTSMLAYLQKHRMVMILKD